MKHSLSLIVFLVLIGIALHVSCTIRDHKQSARYAITADTSIIMVKNDNQEYIWGLDLQILGEFLDSAEFKICYGQTVYYTVPLLGKVDTLYHTDWYSDSCWLVIKKGRNSKLELTLNYKFLD